MVSTLDKRVLGMYLGIHPPPNKFQCMYVWVDGSMKTLRCKSRTVASIPISPNDLPRWEFCGSATELDVSDIADVYAQPVVLYKDPFRTGDNKLVLCETYTRTCVPTFANNRYNLMGTSEKLLLQKTQFGFQQPYTILQTNGRPFGVPECGFPDHSESSVDQSLDDCPGADRVYGRSVAEAHYRACLYAGVNISGMKAVSKLGQWEYQISIYDAVTTCDDVWMSRFLLKRVAEDFGVEVNFEAKPAENFRNPVTASLTFSNEDMRKYNDKRNTKEMALKLEEQKKSLELSEKESIFGRIPKFQDKSGYILVPGLLPDSDPYLVVNDFMEIILRC